MTLNERPIFRNALAFATCVEERQGSVARL